MEDYFYTIYDYPNGDPFVKYTTFKGSSTKKAGECKSYAANRKRNKNKKTHRR